MEDEVYQLTQGAYRLRTQVKARLGWMAAAMLEDVLATGTPLDTHEFAADERAMIQQLARECDVVLPAPQPA